MFLKILRIKIPLNLRLYISDSNKLIFISPQFNKCLYFCKNAMFCSINNNNKELVLFFKLNKIKQKILFFKTFKNNIIKTLKKTKIYEKKLLKLVGVGFKVTLVKNSKYNILCFKLGFSHLIFVRIPVDVYVKTLKNVLYLSCFNKLKLLKLCNLIKNLKIPDVYKGKGFFFEYERFLAKKGKKV